MKPPCFCPVNVPLKWHGGKNYLAGWIIGLMPRHRHYVEAYAGGLAVLLTRDPEDPALWLEDSGDQGGVSEVINDIDGQLTNFWRVLRDDSLFPRFVRQIEAVPLSRAEWQAAHAHVYGQDSVADAVAFFVDCRQSLAGRRKCFTPLTRTRTRRHMNGGVSEWLSAVNGLSAVHGRLRRVVVENMPALDLIRREDNAGTLFYADPPYLPRTRTAPDVYAHEMSEADHCDLLDTVVQCKGKVMLSGYANGLYDSALAGWNRHTRDIANHASGAGTKGRETEVLWCNF